MESSHFHSTAPRPGLDGDVEMRPSEEELQALRQASPPLQAGFATPSSQIVLHRSRRRPASQELTAENSPKSRGEGWRPVRLQGYSEDPMKDEIIRGQTETIKLLQLQVQNLQNGHDNSDVVDLHAEEVELALRQEQAKSAEQEDLIESLRKELRIYQIDDDQHGRKPRRPQAEGLENFADLEKHKHGGLTRKIDTQLESTSPSTLEDSPMILELDSGKEPGVTNSPIHNPLNTRQDIVENSWAAEHQPRATTVPLPLTFKRAWGRRRPVRKALGSPPPTDSPGPPIWTNSSASASTPPTSAESGHQLNPTASLEAKVDLIMSTLGIATERNSLNQQRRGRRLPASEFRTPGPRVLKAEGRIERLAWVRNQLQSLLGLKQDRDILNNRSELYYQDTPLKRRMAQFEKDERGLGPATLEPMQVNWDVIYGRWNECLFSLFLTHCKEEGYCDGVPTEEDEDEMNELFFKRLERIQAIIKQYRPNPNETIAQADERYSNRHLIKLSVARRNRRRAELFNTRCDINMDHLPEDLGGVENGDEEIKHWVDRYNLNEAFGIEGTSSDGTDEYDSDSFFVHTMKWRNRDLAKKMRSTDAARRTTNEYGNTRPGNKPRTRKRRSADESRETVRKIPAGLPINCYDEKWYNALSAKKKRDLCTKPALKILADWESD